MSVFVKDGVGKLEATSVEEQKWNPEILDLFYPDYVHQISYVYTRVKAVNNLIKKFYISQHKHANSNS